MTDNDACAVALNQCQWIHFAAEYGNGNGNGIYPMAPAQGQFTDPSQAQPAYPPPPAPTPAPPPERESRRRRSPSPRRDRDRDRWVMYIGRSYRSCYRHEKGTALHSRFCHAIGSSTAGVVNPGRVRINLRSVPMLVNLVRTIFVNWRIGAFNRMSVAQESSIAAIHASIFLD